MTLTYAGATLRQVLAIVWLVLMAWVGWFWLGMAGVGLVCVAATRWLRALWRSGPCTVVLVAQDIQQVWLSSYAVGIVTRDASPAVWLFKDECPAAQWASLLRFLHRHTPRQALGLSISS